MPFYASALAASTSNPLQAAYLYAAANAAAAAVNPSNTSNQSIVTTSPSNSSISSANSSFHSENKNSQLNKRNNKKSKKKLNNSISDSDSNSYENPISENKIHNNEDSQDNNKTVQTNSIFREDNKNKCKDPLISPSSLSSTNRIIKTDERFLQNSSSLYSQYQQASHYLNHQYLTSSSLIAAAVAAGVPLSQLNIPSGNSNNNTNNNSAFSPTHQTILSIPTSSSVSIPFY